MAAGALAAQLDEEPDESPRSDQRAIAAWNDTLTQLRAAGSYAWTARATRVDGAPGGALVGSQQGAQDLIGGQWRSEEAVSDHPPGGPRRTSQTYRIVAAGAWSYGANLDANGRPEVPWEVVRDSHVESESTQRFDLGPGAQSAVTLLLEHVVPLRVDHPAEGTRVHGSVPLAFATFGARFGLGVYPVAESGLRARDLVGEVPVTIYLNREGVPGRLSVNFGATPDQPAVPPEVLNRMRVTSFEVEFTDHGRPYGPTVLPPPEDQERPGHSPRSDA